MSTKPTKKQLEFMSWEFGMFFHFGIRCFFPGHSDWDGVPMPASKFNPTQLDCNQWVRIAKKAGAKYAVLVCKHHDGFANWPSKYSEYSVAQSPWKDGKGDVVDEFVKACRSCDMRVGFYYSPAQWGGNVKFTDGTDYDDYFINQISELLTNYGKIDYLWFDGNGSGDHKYDKVRIINAIRALQPEIMIFEMWDNAADTRWIDNEDGYANMPNNNVVNRFPLGAPEGTAKEPMFMPAECDVCMRSQWFDCWENTDTIKSLGELMGIYDYSVGRGANLLLNIGPDRRGLLPEPDVKRLLEFGDEIRRCYGTPLRFFDAVKEEEENKWSVTADRSVFEAEAHSCGKLLVDTVIIEEDITDGQSIEEFRIYADLPVYKRQRCVYVGYTVGHKAICHFPAFRTGKLTLEVLKANGEVKIKSIKAFYTGR